MDERRRASNKQEKEGLKRYGGQAHSGSGSGWMNRHDGRTSQQEDRAISSGTLFEFKTVLGGKKQITVKASDLKSVELEAIRQGRLPVLQVELAGRRYVVLTEEDFLEQWESHGRAAAPEQQAGSQ